MIRVGQRIKVPSAGGRVSTGVASVEKGADGVIHYKVRRGDTLSHIARRFGTRISVIRKMNSLGRRSMIRTGQILKLPGKATGGSTNISPIRNVMKSDVKAKSSFAKVHVVKRGETLIDIAKRYRVSLGRIARSNDLRNRSVIRIGRRLVIPE